MKIYWYACCRHIWFILNISLIFLCKNIFWCLFKTISYVGMSKVGRFTKFYLLLFYLFFNPLSLIPSLSNCVCVVFVLLFLFNIIILNFSVLSVLLVEMCIFLIKKGGSTWLYPLIVLDFRYHHLYIIIRNRKVVWKHGPYCWYFGLNLKYILATFCRYDLGAKASEAVQKIATDQKEYRECSSCIIIS